MHLVNRKSEIVNGDWLPDMDLNHDKQIQSLLCYRYTIGQAGACSSVYLSPAQSSRRTSSTANSWNGFDSRAHPSPLPPGEGEVKRVVRNLVRRSCSRCL